MLLQTEFSCQGGQTLAGTNLFFITIISAKIISNYYKAMHEVGKTDMLSAGMLSMFMHHINTKLGG